MKTSSFEILEGTPLRVKFYLESGQYIIADIFDLRSINENADMYLNDTNYYYDEILELGNEFIDLGEYELKTN